MRQQRLHQPMPFAYIQDDVDTWTSKYDPQYWPPHEIFTRLGEEMGELTEEMVKKGPGVGEELSDIIFTITCMANAHHISLDKEWKTYMQKRYAVEGKEYQQAISFDQTLNDIQLCVKAFGTQYASPEELVAELTIKQGRLAREINHLHGNKKKKEGEKETPLGGELSDILYTVTRIANKYDIALDNEWERMMQEKMYGRDKERFVRKPTSSRTG